jgi:hypothetical protein
VGQEQGLSTHNFIAPLVIPLHHSMMRMTSELFGNVQIRDQTFACPADAICSRRNCRSPYGSRCFWLQNLM